MVNTFINADFDEEIYIKVLPGFRENDEILLVLKTFYGLRRFLYL